MEDGTKTCPLGETPISSNATDRVDPIPVTRRPTSHIETGITSSAGNLGTLINSSITQQRIARLGGAATWIFEDVLFAMQNSEEAGGPEGEDYFALMQAIIDEATDRMATYREILSESR